MENNEFKEGRIENHTCYYFDGIIKLKDFDLDNILIDEKSYKTLIDPKPLRIRFFRLFGSEKYEAISKRTRYLISQKSGITYIFSLYFAKIKVDSYNSLPIEKRLTLHNVIIYIKSVLNKHRNRYYYKFFLEKCSYQLAKKIITSFCT